MRYIRRGRSRVYWLADPLPIANTSAPTVAEITAGVDITTEVQNLVNFEVLTAPLAIAGSSSPMVTTRRGRSTVQGTPEINFYDRSDVLTERGLLAPGSIGYLVLLPDGAPSAGQRAEVWRVQAHGPANGWTVEQAAARWSTRFAVLDRPTVEATQA